MLDAVGYATSRTLQGKWGRDLEDFCSVERSNSDSGTPTLNRFGVGVQAAAKVEPHEVLSGWFFRDSCGNAYALLFTVLAIVLLV